MSFRLVNEEHTISVEEFNELFKLMEEGEEGTLEDPQPEDYNRNEFWSLISSEAVFTPSRAKINSIRNPVLRYMAKALVYYPLAHTEAGSMSTEILFVLWGMLKRRRINIGHYIIKNLERQSKRQSGKLCCGGIVAALAFKFGVSFEGRTPDPGPMILDWDTFKRSNIILVDRRGAGYFRIDQNTCIRFPDPQLFAVSGWGYQTNWKMDTPDHLEKIESDPPQGEGAADAVPNYVDPAYLPQPHIPEELMQIENAQAAMNEDDEEPATEYEEGQSSQPKRSRPRGRPSNDSYLAEIAAGVRSLRVSRDQQEARWIQAQQWNANAEAWRFQCDTRLDNFGTRLDHYGEQLQQLQTRFDASDAASQAFYHAYYARFPPPAE